MAWMDRVMGNGTRDAPWSRPMARRQLPAMMATVDGASPSSAATGFCPPRNNTRSSTSSFLRDSLRSGREAGGVDERARKQAVSVKKQAAIRERPAQSSLHKNAMSTVREALASALSAKKRSVSLKLGGASLG